MEKSVWVGSLHNRLLDGVRRIEPALHEVANFLDRWHPGRWTMTGSGSCFIIAAPDQGVAKEEVQLLRSRLEEFSAETPLTVGSPQEFVDKTLTFRESFGDYQRQLFLVDHAGLPLKTVLEQLDLLGEVLPDLRAGFAEGRPEQVPDAPTHASLVAARDAAARQADNTDTTDAPAEAGTQTTERIQA